MPTKKAGRKLKIKKVMMKDKNVAPIVTAAHVMYLPRKPNISRGLCNPLKVGYSSFCTCMDYAKNSGRACAAAIRKTQAPTTIMMLFLTSWSSLFILLKIEIAPRIATMAARA